MPELRTFVAVGVQQLYDQLKQSHNIHQQVYGSHLTKYPPSGQYNLEYRNINNNDTVPGSKNAAKTQFDYRVPSATDLARLFLPSHMAKFHAFSDSDASALLGLIININDPKFAGAQPAAKYVRQRRNQWAHGEDDLQHWSKNNLQDAFSDMTSLLSAVHGSAVAVPAHVCRELDKWLNIGMFSVKCES